MREDTARTIANGVIAAAAVAAAVVVLRVPPLRRVAWGLVRTAILTTVPAWVAREVQTAWRESGHRAARPPEAKTGS